MAIKYKLLGHKNPQTKANIFSARAVLSGTMDLEAVAHEVSSRCTVNRSDVYAMLTALEETIINALHRGESVRLGHLGSFRPTISSSSVSVAKEFKPSHIRGVRVCFTLGSTLRSAFRLTNKALVLERVGEKAAE